MAKIGPHEGIELQLMLQGKKQVALFFDGIIPDEMLTYIESRYFSTIEKYYCPPNGFYTIVFKEEYRQQAEHLSSLIGISGFDPEREREIGKILGYDSEDIEFFIALCQQRLIE
ncbi:hemocin immunity protein [Volucribacter amazonae]|uniref:Hemocin immunity protein n=1 Tax=Volucribacter amazonae TaxID=256731 RepID=A0A9X4SPL8_9PAST|nr:hemocin immunity protein [Volucribacter amazonae]MDG6894221.1 hypothetical protein [Volucribacter amazonae]